MQAWENNVHKAELPQSPPITNEQDPAQLAKNASSALPQFANEQDMSKTQYNHDAQLKRDDQEFDGTNRKDEQISSSQFESLALKLDDIKDACSDRLQKLNDAIQDMKEFNQRMADLELHRQLDREGGMEM